MHSLVYGEEKRDSKGSHSVLGWRLTAGFTSYPGTWGIDVFYQNSPGLLVHGER